MEQVPLREYLDQRFRDHTAHVDRQFEDLKLEVRRNRAVADDHDHSQYLTLMQLLGVLTLVGSIVGLFIVVYA